MNAAGELRTARFQVSILFVGRGARRLGFFEYRLDERVPSLLVDLAVIRRGVRPLHNLAVLGTWRNRLFANWENFFQIGFHFVKIIKVA